MIKFKKKKKKVVIDVQNLMLTVEASIITIYVLNLLNNKIMEKNIQLKKCNLLIIYKLYTISILH